MDTKEGGPISGYPYSKYTHFIMLATDCSNGHMVMNYFGSTPSEWTSLINYAHAAGTKVIINTGLGGNLTSCTTSGAIDTYVNELKNLISGKDPVHNPYNVVFDGIDLDWEPSINNQQYISLIQKLRAALGPSTPGFGPNTITMATWGWYPAVAVATYQYLDQINMMNYPMAGPNSTNSSGQQWSWYNFAIRSPAAGSGSLIADFNGLRNAGVPANKIGFGLPFYGYKFGPGCKTAMALGCPISSGEMHYNSMVGNSTYWNGGANKRYDGTYQANYLSVSATNEFIGYVDAEALQATVAYLKSVGAGGIMIFNMMMEYMPNASGVDAQFPLSAALHAAFGGGTTTTTAPLITSSSTLPGGTVNVPYSQTLTANGTTPITWSVVSGALPAGLNLAPSTGVISGTPTAASTSNFTLRATNSNGSNDKPVSLTIAADPYAYWKLDEATGTTAAGGGANATFFNLPSWKTGSTCDAGACLSFNGTNQYGSATLDLAGTQAVTLSFWMNWPAYANDDRMAFEFTPNFNNATTGFMVDPNSSAAGGGQFEVGLKGDVGYNQVVFARPTAGTLHHFAFVFDKSAPAANQVIPYVDGMPVSYTKVNNDANTNSFGSDTLFWMSRGGASLFGAGVLDEVRVYKRALNASEIQTLAAGGGNLSQIAPVITTTSLQQAIVGKAYSQSFSATGSTPMSWKITAGSLPAGLSMSSGGVLSGTPTAAGTFNFTVQASNAAGVDTQALSLTALAAPAITTASPLPQGTVGAAYSRTLTATGSTPITWAITAGTLPAGLSLSSGGLLGGTPAAAGNFAFTVQASNAAGTASQALSLSVVAAAPTNIAPAITCSSSLPQGRVSVGYSATLTATGTAPITWKVASGTLPAGLSLATAGLISGTPTVPGTSNFTVQASNAAGTATKAVSLTVAADLYAYWKLDEGTGTVAAGGGVNVTLYNSPSWKTGASCKLGNCLAFNGTNQYGSAALNLSGTRTVTLSFWMNWPAYANDDKLAFEFTPNFNNATTGFMVDPNSTAAGGGKFEVGLQGDAGYNQVVFVRPSAGTWHHYAFIFDKSAPAANQVTPYVDGVAVPYTKVANSANTNSFGTDALFWMSRGGSGLFGAGLLDDVRIYTRALSAAQIQVLAIPPAVTITSPVSGTVMKNTLPITVNVSQSVASVQYRLDGVAFATVSQAPFTYNWTPQLSNTLWHKLDAVARNANGDTAVSAAVQVRKR